MADLARIEASSADFPVMKGEGGDVADFTDLLQISDATVGARVNDHKPLDGTLTEILNKISGS